MSITHLNLHASAVPAGTSQVSDLHVEEGQKGVSTERTGCVQVGIVCRPASHDFLIIHQAVTCLAAGTAGDQQLKKEKVEQMRRKRSVPSHRQCSSAFYLHAVVVEDAGVAGVAR